MSTGMRGWIELDGKRLLRVRSMTFTGGRPKTKITPAGSSRAVDTHIGPQAVSGSIVIYGTEQNGYEKDWLGMCNGEDSYTLVRHFSTTDRWRLRNVEFSTYDSALPEPETEMSVTINFVASEVVPD